jgi:hypothetical protein
LDRDLKQASSRQSQKDLLFMNKNQQKNLVTFIPLVSQPREADQKFFGSFFQKRTSCFSSISARAIEGAGATG